MMPSFRLILVTFLCGFAVVFAGLRMAVRFNDSHEAAPVLAGQTPVQVTLTAGRESYRGISLVPAMYDMRFAVGAAPAVLVRLAPSALERPLLPLSVAPPADAVVQDAIPAGMAAEPTKEPIGPEGALAAVQPEPAVPDSPATPQPEAPAPGDPQQ